MGPQREVGVSYKDVKGWLFLSTPNTSKNTCQGPASHILVPVQVLATLLLGQLPANIPGKATDNGASAWALHPRGMSGCCSWILALASPELPAVAIWGNEPGHSTSHAPAGATTPLFSLILRNAGRKERREGCKEGGRKRRSQVK